MGVNAETLLIKSGQVWTGTYSCGQGETNLQLSIDKVSTESTTSSNGIEVYPITATYIFKSRAGPGSFVIQGAFAPKGRILSFTPIKWLERPRGYRMVGMQGNLSVDGIQYAGKINSNGCGSFQVSLDGQTSSKPDIARNAPTENQPHNTSADSNDPYRLLREGSRAVQERDYGKAKDIFNSIIDNSSDSRLINTAKNQLKMIEKYEFKPPTKPRLTPDERTYQAALKHIQKKDYHLAEKTFDNIIYRGKDPKVVAKSKAYKKKIPQLISQQWEEEIEKTKRFVKILEEEKVIEEEKAIAEEERKLAIIEARTKAYPLNNINIPTSQRIAHQGLVLGETSKEDAVEILRRLIDTSRRGNLPETIEAFSKLTGIPDVYGLADLGKMKEFNRTLHKNISLSCISYGSATDCLYFYKNKLIGFKWDLGNDSCGDCVKAKESAMAFNTAITAGQALAVMEVNDHSLKRGNATYIISQTMRKFENMTREVEKTSVWGVKSKSKYGGEITLKSSFCIYPTQLEGLVSSLDKKGLFCQ